MPKSTDEQRLIQTECLVLQALCQGTREGSVREAGRRILEDYRWREPTHRVVLEVLMTMPASSPETIRDLLPCRLTRMGFPDVAWEHFFQPHSLSKEEAERLMRELAEST